MISDDFKKVLKNHACIHDACGFLLNRLGIGPVYMCAVPTNIVSVSSVLVNKWIYLRSFGRLVVG